MAAIARKEVRMLFSRSILVSNCQTAMTSFAKLPWRHGLLKLEKGNYYNFFLVGDKKYILCSDLKKSNCVHFKQVYSFNCTTKKN